MSWSVSWLAASSSPESSKKFSWDSRARDLELELQIRYLGFTSRSTLMVLEKDDFPRIEGFYRAP